MIRQPLPAARLLLLDRWTRHAAIGAEHAAVARFRPEQLAATPTVVEELACVSRHGLGGLMAAMRTGQRALQDEFGRHAFRRRNEWEVSAGFSLRPCLSCRFTGHPSHRWPCGRTRCEAAPADRGLRPPPSAADPDRGAIRCDGHWPASPIPPAAPAADRAYRVRHAATAGD